jgi:hypothetical protein
MGRAQSRPIQGQMKMQTKQERILFAVALCAIIAVSVFVIADGVTQPKPVAPASGGIGVKAVGPTFLSGFGSTEDGTAAVPAFTFYSDQDTGLYRSSANVLGVAVGGSSVGTFDSNGFNGGVVASTLKIGSYTQGGATRGGYAASVADAGGIVHGFTVTPTYCVVTPLNAVGAISATIHAITATQFTVNVPVTSAIYWICGY